MKTPKSVSYLLSLPDQPHLHNPRPQQNCNAKVLMSSADCFSVSEAKRSKIWASASASIAAVGSSKTSLGIRAWRIAIWRIARSWWAKQLIWRIYHITPSSYSFICIYLHMYIYISIHTAYKRRTHSNFNSTMGIIRPLNKPSSPSHKSAFSLIKARLNATFCHLGIYVTWFGEGTATTQIFGG